MMGALGHHSAVAEIMGVNISGFAAWWIWRTIYLMKLPGWGRRLKVASSWTLDLLLPAELVELKLTGSMGMTQEHFEPGEEVFHQGDIGDRIYIIVSGEAEVVHESGDEQRVLARLGAGEYFGEMALLKQSTRGATVRCCAPMNTLSLPKREFSMLAAYVPQLRETLEDRLDPRGQSQAALLLVQSADPSAEKLVRQGLRQSENEETFLALMRIRGIEVRAPGGYAEAFYAHKLTIKA